MSANLRSNLILDLDGTLIRLNADWVLIKTEIREQLQRLNLPTDGNLDAQITRLRDSAASEYQNFLPRLSELECVGVEAAAVNSALIQRVLAIPEAQRAIFSMNCRATIVKALSREELRSMRVATLIGKEDLRRAKPDPEGIQLILRQCRWRPEDCLMIGDSENDRGAAEAAGVAFEWVLWD